jgi:hypothetical protein
MSDILKRDVSGKLKIFTHPKFILGFSNIQISQVINHAYKLFTIEDICNHVEIWDIHHAYKVFNILQNVFCDMNDVDLHANPDDVSSDEEEYLLPEDWNDLRTDEELAMLAINEMSLTELDDDCTLKNKVCIFNTPSVAKFTHLKACFFCTEKYCATIMPLSISVYTGVYIHTGQS